jgi:hypothetical protein
MGIRSRIPSLRLQAGQCDGGATIDCPEGNLSMQTFKKLPMNRPSRINTIISKAKFFILILNVIIECMIHQRYKLGKCKN